MAPTLRSASIVSPLSNLKPSAEYLQQAHIPAVRHAQPAARHRLLVLDLNNTLVDRKTRDTAGSRNAHVRPWVSHFLAYAFRSNYSVMIWSSAQPANVQLMLQRLAMVNVPGTGSQAWQNPAQPEALRFILPERKDPDLLAVWARDTLGLTAQQYSRKVPTVKDLQRVWNAFPQFSQADTILVDDSHDKAALQPFNHIFVPSWSSSMEAASLDTTMLRLIGALEELAHYDDVSSALSSGAFGDLHFMDAENPFLQRGGDWCMTNYLPMHPVFMPNLFRPVATQDGT